MNVLILTGRFGMGHYSAASTISQQIQQQYPTANIVLKDIFELITPRHYHSFYQAYTAMVNHASIFYNTYYKLTEKNKRNIKPPMMLLLFQILYRLLKQVQPDIIFSTLPLCSQLVSQYQNYHYLSAPLVTCITDISTHSEWINEHTSYYLVGSRAVKEELINRGVAPSIIHVSGIPVKSEFKQKHPVYGMEKKQLLIMGGGLGLIPTSPKFYQQLNQLHTVKTTIILGNNQKLYRKLSGIYDNIEVIGYTDKVYEYMQKADMILSKPGGITMFESIYSELPLLVICPFLEQEIKNAKFIEHHGIGKVIWEKNTQIVNVIEQSICDENLLTTIRAQMRAFKLGLEEEAVEKILNTVTSSAGFVTIPNTIAMPRKGPVI